MSIMSEITTGVTGAPQNFQFNSSREDSTAWVEGIVVQGYSVIDSGWVVIESQNSTDFSVWITYEMLDIRHMNNNERFTFSFECYPHANAQKDSFLVDDCTFLPRTTSPFNFFAYLKVPSQWLKNFPCQA